MDEATPAEIENAQTLPCTVWNAIVFDHASGSREYLTQLRQAVAIGTVGFAIVKVLIEQKQTQCLGDHR
jgi:hypothetical protein